MKILASALVASALLLGSHAAMAQPDHDDHGRYDHDHDRGHGRHDHDRGGYDRGWHGGPRDYGYRDHGRYYAHGPVYYAPRHDHWARGHRYYGPTYVVSDYRSYRLRPPPRGYHWVRDRGTDDFLLVAVATGIILDIATH
jgi:Ni/Co efflux regulator RcnB